MAIKRDKNITKCFASAIGVGDTFCLHEKPNMGCEYVAKEVVKITDNRVLIFFKSEFIKGLRDYQVFTNNHILYKIKYL